MTPTSTPEPATVWHGNDISMADVLEALGQIRKRFALAEAGDTEHPHPRSCVMTLVGIAISDDEERRAQRATRAIGNHHPAQVVVVRDQATFPTGRIDATITTDIHRPEGACAVQCELVVVRVKGAAGGHLAALIDPLLASGVPTYLWWVGTPPFGKHELEDALRISDVLVVDSARFEAPYRSFLDLTRLSSSAHHRLGIADMQWARLEPWRESVAQFFSPPDRRPFLNGISEVGVDYAGDGRGNRTGAALLIGWLSSALRWKLQRAVAGTGGVVAAHFVAEGWRPVEVAFRSVPKAHLAQGEISRISIAGAGGGRTFQLSVLRDPERRRSPASDLGAGAYRSLHLAEGEDEAALELAQRRAEWHRDVLHQNQEKLHHTATGELPGDSVPRPRLVARERRRDDSSLVLLTLIDIGGGGTLRHIQRVESEDEATLLLSLLSRGTRDPVYRRSLDAAAELMRAL